MTTEINNQVIETYLLYSKMLNETDKKIRSELEKKYDEAEKKLEILEDKHNQE